MSALINTVSYLMALVAVFWYCLLVSQGDYYNWSYPVLIGATVCKLLSSSSSYSDRSWIKTKTFKRGIISTAHQRIENYFSQYSAIQTFHSMRKTLSCIISNDNHYNVIFISTFIILAPCAIFYVKRVSHHLSSDDGSADHEELANDFGKLGAASFAFLLLPVSKQSSILRALELSEIHIIRIHIYSGVLAIFGGIMHGLYYTWIWIKLRKYTYQDVFPSSDCWADLHRRDYSKECHSKFINLLGITCALSFVILGSASIWWVRRRFYRVFYFIHIAMSVLILFGLVMHYNKMIWFMAPSLLHYMASNVPIFAENLLKSWQGGVRISKVVCIPDSGGCVELSIRHNENNGCIVSAESTIGKYIELSVPEISSSMSHPFSAYSHQNHQHDIKVLFRPCGQFTTQLSKTLKLLTSLPENTPGEIDHNLHQNTIQTYKRCPKILVNRLGTSSNQLEHTMKHDSIIIIAGGVGITCYISLISTIRSIAASMNEVKRDHRQIEATTVTEITAPPGKLGILLDSHSSKHPNGQLTYVSSVHLESPLSGQVCVGDQIVSVDREDVTRRCLAEVNAILTSTRDSERVLGFIPSPGEDTGEGTYAQHNDVHLTQAKRIHIHWMSRDEGLINHVMNNYFTPNCQDESDRKDSQSPLSINFVVHHTNRRASSTANESIDCTTIPPDFIPEANGSFASPSSIYDSKQSPLQNILTTLALSSIAFGGLWIINYCYKNVQEKHVVETRLLPVIAITVWSIATSAIFLFFAKVGFCSKFAYSKLGNDASDIECATIPESTSDDDTNAVVPIQQSETELDVANECATRNIMTVSHLKGRPNISAIIHDAMNEAHCDSNDIGIMMCGPTSMTSSVWTAIKERRQDSGEWEHVYQEVFEL